MTPAEEVEAARDQAASHRTIAYTLLAVSLLWLPFAGAWIADRNWLALVMSALGACGFAAMARREWRFADEWAAAADMWERDDVEAVA